MKKHAVHKLYWNLVKEEKWINSMAAMGYSLTDYWWMHYAFEETEKNEYAYAIQMLSADPKSTEGKCYISFLEESGIECVATYMKWAYFRKKKSELTETGGKLVIYSDYESQKSHARRIVFFYLPFMLMNLPIGLVNFSNAIRNYNYDGGESVVFLFAISVLNIVISLAIASLIIPQLKCISVLKRKHKLNE